MAKKKRKDIVVLVAPLHGVTATRRELRRARRGIRNFEGHRPDVIMHTEGYRPKRRGFFSSLVLWKHFTGPWTKPDPRGRITSWSNVILTRKRYKTIWRIVRRAANASIPLKIAPVRWLVEWDLKIRRHNYALFLDHPHAGIKRHPKDEAGKDRLKEYKHHSVVRRGAIRSALSRKLSVIFGGDLNYGKGTAEEWMPESVFNDFKMRFKKTDVTWLAWSEDLVLVDIDIIPATVNGQDHGWLLGTLRPRNAM